MAIKLLSLMLVGCMVFAGCGSAMTVTKVEKDRVDQQSGGNRDYAGSEPMAEGLGAEPQRTREMVQVTVDMSSDEEIRQARRQARLNRSYMWGADEPQPGYPDRWTMRRTRNTGVSSQSYSQPVPQVTLPEENSLEQQSVESFSRPMALPPPEPVSLPPQSISTAPAFTDYTVQRGDTLGGISQKVYGTASKWQKIFNFNSDVLKNPNKVYPGQKLKIPQE